MAEGRGLEIARLSALVSAAAPVELTGSEDEWRLVLKANRSGIAAEVEENWLQPLRERQATLLLPEYARRYMTILFGAASVVCRGPNAAAGGSANLVAFVSLVRQRFVCVSLWLTAERVAGGPDPKQFAAAWADKTLQLELDRGSALGRLLALPSDGPVPAPAMAGYVFDAVTRLAGGTIAVEDKNTAMRPDARFEAAIARLAGTPEGFESGASGTEADLRWRYQAAELLPEVEGTHEGYRPEFLLGILGTDMMDSAGGHYFLTRRRVLALLDSESCERVPRLVSNIVTWTQLLCENAAIQLAAIRTNNERLQVHIDQGKAPSRTARALIRSQFRLYQDLDESQNIAVSLEPIFWQHQETLKQISGISTLATSLSERFAAFASVSTMDEQRNFEATTQALTLVLGALALIAPTVQIAVGEDSSILVTTLLAAGSGLVGALAGLLLLIALRRG